MPVCVHCATPLPDGSQFCSQCGTPVPGRRPDDPTFTPQGREIYERLKEATEGKYEVIRELGRGGMAVVFLGYQKSLDREVAIKVLLPLLGYDPEIVERFTREARTQGKLDHPNIIQVYEIYNEGGLTFFTVPYISGESMRVFLRDDPQPPLEKVFRYLTQAADALAYAHRRGVVHRDVKPDNILVDTERDRVILTDFGIAKALTAEKTLTTPGDLLGTPQYMSPEQGEGRHDLDGRADQYSLGLIGYEMLAGRRPFLADNLAELMYKHRFEEPPSLDEVRPDAPSHLRAAIQRAISKDRDERFPTMDAFLTALEGPWEVDREEDEGEGRTEPMPPPGSDATTVRVPTPPSTPRPAAVDDTAPEAKEPELEPTLKTPEPWEAADEPTMKTPEPLAAPGGPAEPGESDEPWAVSQPWETPAGEAAGEVVAPPTPLLGEAKPPGVPRALLFGGGAAVVAVVAALVIFGPLGSGGEPGTTEPVSSAETGAVAEGAELTGEQGTEQPTGAEEAPGAAAESPVQGTPATPAESEGTPPPVEVTRAARTSEPPAVTGPPQVPDGTPPQLQNAMETAHRYREGAVAAVGVTSLIALDRRLVEADRLLLAGRQEDALAAYSGLIPEYRDRAAAAAAPAAEAEQPQPAVDEGLRAAAEEARGRVLSSRQAALDVGAGTLFGSQLSDLDSRRRDAVNALEQGRFADANAAFEELAGEYADLAARATREWQSRMRQANTEMREMRDSALTLGADRREPDRLADVDATRSSALSAAQGGRYADAVPLFQQAGDGYAQLVTDLAAALQAEAEAAAAAAAAAEEPEEQPSAAEEPPPAPDVIIADMIEVFRQAFQEEDLDRMSAELYRGPIPGGDSRIYRAFFDRADDLRAQTKNVNIRVSEDGMTASADVELATTFRQARMGTQGEQDLRWRMRFVLDADGWRLERSELR